MTRITAAELRAQVDDMNELHMNTHSAYTYACSNKFADFIHADS